MHVQLYLDIKFVICFASQGRYLSRNLHRVVNDIIAKAMAAFAATGMDPYGYAMIVLFRYIIIIIIIVIVTSCFLILMSPQLCLYILNGCVQWIQPVHNS